MGDFLIPGLIGFLAAISVVAAFKMFRRRTANRHPSALEVPQSRQHRRAIERRASKRG